MTTGKLPKHHGVIANGFYWREQRKVEMWTAGNDCISAPQIWDWLGQHDESLTSAVWFPLHSKGAQANFICTPAPIHNPDGSESLWCYTRPTELYGTLRDKLGHFPLQHFWGPMANIQSPAWIADSAVFAANEFRPNFFYIYLPHLDYAAQKHGPDSETAQRALGELDLVIGKLVEGVNASLGAAPLWPKPSSDIFCRFSSSGPVSAQMQQEKRMAVYPSGWGGRRGVMGCRILRRSGVSRSRSSWE